MGYFDWVLNQFLDKMQYQDHTLILYSLKAVKKIVESLKKLLRNLNYGTVLLEEISDKMIKAM